MLGAWVTAPALFVFAWIRRCLATGEVRTPWPTALNAQIDPLSIGRQFVTYIRWDR
jgi:hypothetical protein